MQQKNIFLKNPIATGLLLFFLICIPFIIITVITLSNKYGQLKIDNFSDFINLPEDGKTEIFQLLYSQVKNEDGNAPNSGATIRQDTIESNYDEKTKIYSGSFVVDIDSVKKTYVVNYVWSDNKDIASDTSINCPTKNIDKYNTGINCINSRGETGKNRLINITPSYIEVKTNLKAYVSLKNYGNNPNDPYLEININSCNDTSIINLTKKTIEDWLDNNYLEKNIVPFEIRNLCDGAY